MQTRPSPIAFLQRHPLAIAITVILLILYVPLFAHWIEGWLRKTISTEHEYFSHALLGFPFAAYVVWEKRDRLLQIPAAPNTPGHLLGIPMLVLGMICYLNPLVNLANLSLPIVLTGLCLWFKGIEGLKLLAFPLLFVLFGTPNDVPYLIAPYTLPLQKFIASTAGFILQQLDIDIQVNQIYLYVKDRIVEVAPYCAGIKMMFTSLYVGLMAVYWNGTWRDRTQLLRFFPGVIVLSVIANIIRNTILTYFHGTGNDAAFKWLHDSWGGDLYSALLLVLVVFYLNWLERGTDWEDEDGEDGEDGEDLQGAEC
jgi:cyanoexosortase B